MFQLIYFVSPGHSGCEIASAVCKYIEIRFFFFRITFVRWQFYAAPCSFSLSQQLCYQLCFSWNFCLEKSIKSINACHLTCSPIKGIMKICRNQPFLQNCASARATNFEHQIKYFIAPTLLSPYSKRTKWYWPFHICYVHFRILCQN